MRPIVLSLVVVAACLTSQTAASQTRGGTAASGTAPSACSLITPDLAAKYIDPRILKYLKPDDSPVGTKGTSCEYGRIGLRVNPLGSGSKPSAPAKDWQPISGVGTVAFYHPLNNTYAELIAWTGPHHIGIQLGVPTGGTMESTKAEAIALANAIIAKLK